MITTSPSLTRLRRRLRLAALSVPAAVGLALMGGSSAYAKPVPSNLGNGLDKLVASNLAITEAQAKGISLRGAVSVAGKMYTDELTAAVATSSLSDESGRLLVRVTLDGSLAVNDLKKSLESSLSTVAVTAVDTTYRNVGVMNAYVDVSEVPKLAAMPGVRAVILEWKPRHNGPVPIPRPTTTTAVAAKPAAATTTTSLGPVTATPTGTTTVGYLEDADQTAGLAPTVGETIAKIGTTFDQGVTQHGIDQINKYYNSAATLDLEGQGMQIACISNSFAANANGPASVDVTNGDLPGSGSAVNTTPTFVLQDDLSSSTSDDEGRGMVQITFKMAPKAKLGFATANGGEVGFANNIRGLAGINSSQYPNASTQGFAADTICDDVGYFDEPFFQDGIISGGIEDAAAAGVSYFSSAANDIGTNGYDSDTRWVANGTGLTAAAGNTALAGTNINLTNVPTNLYAGGFHNFNPSGLDVAQTVNIAANNTVPTIFQWNDPYDQNTSVNVTGTLLSTSGTYTTTDLTFTATGTVTAGTSYQVVEAAANGSTFDGIVTVYRSDGTTVIAGPQDTGTDETVRFVAPANDTGFVVKIGHYSTTTGDFTLKVQSFSGFTTAPVTTSLSVLVFNVSTGAYIAASSLTADATATNQPVQLGYTNRPSGTQVQYVIARSIVPAAGSQYPTHVRYLLPGNGRAGYGPAEYFTYNTVTTGGHAMSPNCNGCAAYSVFRPSLPETFTSPGPVNIYYDKNDNRLATPEIRLQPRVAFADGANVSANLSTGAGFASDGTQDPDTTQGQFYGTSATGPHAAAIAALVLQNKGGRRSVTPAQMTSLLERSTFPHDLDPNFASGSTRVTGGTTGTGKVTLTISSDGSAGTAAQATGLGDTTSFQLTYVGGSSVTSLVFNQGGTAATSGNVTGGNNGVVYGSADATIGGTVTYFENSLPGTTFFPATKAFTLNTTLADSVTGATATPSNPNTTDPTRYFTETIAIPAGNFPSSKTLRFTIGRGVAFAATAAAGTTTGTVVGATTGAAYYSADIFGGGVSLPSGTVNTSGMTFSGTTADGGKFSGVIQNRIGSGWAKTDGYGFVNAPTAVSQTVQ